MCLVRPRPIGLIQFTELQFQRKIVQKVPCLSMKVLVFGEKILKSYSFIVTRINPSFPLLFSITVSPSPFLKFDNHATGRCQEFYSKTVPTTPGLSTSMPSQPGVVKCLHSGITWGASETTDAWDPPWGVVIQQIGYGPKF